jgi:prepilin-type N-terminal cleavage/methylation domain-containing protein
MSVTRIRWRNCRGVTLTELLVGVAIGGIVLVGVVTAWGISVRSSAYMAEATRLHHDLRSTMQVVAHDLRRADGGVNMLPERAVRFNADGSCVTYYVDGQARGFRLFEGVFQMYFNNDPTLGTPTCDPGGTNFGWVPLYDSLAAGGFAVTGFQAAWRAICYPFDETADVEVFDSLADASVYQRCAAMTDVTEVLQVTLTLDGTITTATTPKSLSLRDVVTLRNNDVR